ncbi:MAG: ORF6N domain-containing protein [Elusimicrobiota bacterium]
MRRNKERFPADFVFQLTTDGAKALRSHFATSKGRAATKR